MIDKITRKDGISYERKKKEKKYDCILNMRFDKEELDKLKELADKEGVKYNTLARNLIVEYIKFKSKGE